MKKLAITGTVILALALSACGGGEETAPAATETAVAAPSAGEAVLPSGATPKDTIDSRRANLKDLGANFKTINDQLKASTPDTAAIAAAATKIAGYSNEIETWFPAGTGPEAGVETEALPVIWSDAAGFAAAAANFKAAAATLSTASVSGDTTAIGAAARGLGPTCKGCHDTYRLKKN